MGTLPDDNARWTLVPPSGQRNASRWRLLDPEHHPRFDWDPSADPSTLARHLRETLSAAGTPRVALVVALEQSLRAAPDLPADSEQRSIEAIAEGEAVGGALASIDGLAQRVGPDSPEVRAAIDAHRASITWKGFDKQVERRLSKTRAQKSKSIARTSSVRPGAPDHRLTSLSPGPSWTLAIDEGGAIPARVGDPTRRETVRRDASSGFWSLRV